MTSRLKPGCTVGILGGGQLGRMLAVAASRLGLKTHVFDPASNAIAGEVASSVTAASFDNESALTEFAQTIDVLTYEFENIPVQALDLLESHCQIYPGRNALSVSQDRLLEKQFMERLALRVAPFANVESDSELAQAVSRIGTPSLLKTRRFGYDGKGQVRLTGDDQAVAAWDSVERTPCVLEGMVDFDCEISVIGARCASGATACFDPGENVHRDGILHTTTIPACVRDSVLDRAKDISIHILNALDYVGVLGVEMFVDGDDILINEIAPRVHNSGHWTQNGCAIDQFEQHIRAICGWPLGDGARHSDVVMTNLIGDEVLDADVLYGNGTDSLHIYGKADVRPGRKMGHVNRVVRSAH